MRNEEIEGRLQNLEVTTHAILQRLKEIESRLPAPVQSEPIHQPVVPPPVIQNIPVPPQSPITEREGIRATMSEHLSELQAIHSSSEEPVRPQIVVPPAPNPDDIEYKFGINGLLRGGAVVIVFAVLFLVALALGRGWITPTIQFVGELVLCFGFIAVGLWKHSEREDFGQLMVGIGSFGLYASFAGGHLYKHLYGGEMLVGLYVLLSMANLGFSHIRASKSFLCIGLIGGLVAALMPMQKDKVLLDFALHFLILIPCALIIVRNKWNEMATLMWIVSTVALVPATTSHFEQVYRVGATYLNCTIALLTFGKTYKPNEFDKHAALQTVMLVLTGFFAIGIDSGHKGSLHALVLTAIALGIGYLLKSDEKVRNATWLGGLIVFAVMTPLGSTQSVAAFWYGTEALILAGLALHFGLVALYGVGLATFVLSLAAYLYFADKQIFSLAPLKPFEENLLLLLLVATTILNVIFAVKKLAKEFGELSLFSGGLLIFVFFQRSLNLVLGHENTSLRTEDIIVLGFGVASLLSIVLASRLKKVGFSIFSSMLSAVTCICALALQPGSFPIWMSPFMLVAATFVVVFTGRYLYSSSEKSYQEPTLFFSGVILSLLFIRAFEFVGLNQIFGLKSDANTAVALTILNIAWTILSVKFRRSAYWILGWSSFALAAGASQIKFDASNPAWLSSALQIVPIISLVILYAYSPRKEAEEPAVASIVIIAGWILLSVFLTQQLTSSWIGLKPVAALTVSWVITAIILIVCGFKFHRRHLRYGSLAIFMVTVGKVFLVDLSELDSFVRVLMLMLLGFGMIGGGYWYILWRRSHATMEESKEVSS